MAPVFFQGIHYSSDKAASSYPPWDGVARFGMAVSPAEGEGGQVSVIVRDMQMPENCLECPMRSGGICTVKPSWVANAVVARSPGEAVIKGKPEWCPLFETKDWREV